MAHLLRFFATFFELSQPKALKCNSSKSKLGTGILWYSDCK